MKILKKDVTLKFILYSFLLITIEMLIDCVFDEYILVNYLYYFWIFMYILLSVAIFILFAWLFTRSISKKFNAEMSSQMDNKNILFANIAHDLRTPIHQYLDFQRL